MKNSTKLLSGLFIAAMCVSAVSIAETYTTTTTTTKYTRPVTTRTVTTTSSPTKVTSTTVDETTNPMYSVNRNDKIQQYQGTTKPAATTTTTKYTRPVTTRTVTTTSSPTTVTSTTVDATTNPMYSVNRNDKIQQYQGTTKPATTTTTTTQYKRPVTTRTVTTTTNPTTKAVSTTSTSTSTARPTRPINNQSREQQIMNDIQSQAQSELRYYEKLKTCTADSLVSGNLALQTYGLSNGLCSFDIKVNNSKTNQMTTLCTFKVPVEQAKKFASDKLKYERSLIGLEELSTEEYTTITNNLTMFTQQYCQQAK